MKRKKKTYRELRDWRHNKSYHKYKGLPDFEAHKNSEGGHDIFSLKNGKRHIGTLSSYGWLNSSCLDKEEYKFGNNLKNAIRFLFLKTQKPVDEKN